MPSHRKPKLSAARNRARTITLCAATIGTAAVPALASAASAGSAPAAAGHSAVRVASQPVIVQALAAAQSSSTQAVAVSDTTESASSTTAATGKTYTVKAGDTLFGIASWSLGSGYKYPELFKLNKGQTENDGTQFTNPDLIQIGWTIALPSGSKTKSHSHSSSSGSSSGSGSSSSGSSSAGSSGSGSSGSSASGSSGSSGSSSSGSSSSSSSSSSSGSSSSSSSGYADDLDGWINQAISILAANGYSVSYNAIYQTAMNESSGDPNAENNYDSNAAAGTPSIGLLQVIQPTFDSYSLPGYDDIWNPVDNIIAAAVYAQDTYGGLDNVVAARCGGSCWYGY